MSIAASSVHAGLLDLGIAGTFNIYTLGSFTGSNSSVQGAAASAGSFAATNYSINQGNVDGAGNPGYALAVGGSLSYTRGSIRNGAYYAAGTQSFTSVGLHGAAVTTAVPFSFSDVSAKALSLSDSLSTLNATGSTAIAFGGMKLTGSGGATTVFNLSASDLSSVNHFNFAQLAAGDTLIVNVSGVNATLQGGWHGFASYNVLFNFYEATSLSFGGGIYGNILAPLATVGSGTGAVNGNVIVENWNSSVALNANHYFVPTDVPGFTVFAPVPEPRTYALMLTGLGVLVCFVRRRKVKLFVRDSESRIAGRRARS
jgi:choice-of-anchor A domain-containing protein